MGRIEILFFVLSAICCIFSRTQNYTLSVDVTDAVGLSAGVVSAGVVTAGVDETSRLSS